MNQDRRKNLIVALLAVCAVGMVLWTLFGDRLTKVTGRMGARAGEGTTAPTTQRASENKASKVSPTSSRAEPRIAPGTPLEPAQPVDLGLIESLFVSWIEAPRRDPFHLSVAPPAKAEGPRAADVLSLSAIWRQSGGRFAVINQRVLTEGDHVASFRLERIDAGAVWVASTNGTERLDFQSAATTARSPNKAQPERPAPPGGGTTHERKLPSPS